MLAASARSQIPPVFRNQRRAQTMVLLPRFLQAFTYLKLSAWRPRGGAASGTEILGSKRTQLQRWQSKGAVRQRSSWSNSNSKLPTRIHVAANLETILHKTCDVLICELISDYRSSDSSFCRSLDSRLEVPPSCARRMARSLCDWDSGLYFEEYVFKDEAQRAAIFHALDAFRPVLLCVLFF